LHYQLDYATLHVRINDALAKPIISKTC